MKILRFYAIFQLLNISLAFKIALDAVCSDFQNISSFDSMIWNFSRPAPWNIFPNTKIVFSNCFKEKIEYFFSKFIPLTNKTYIDFLSEMMKKGCFYYPHGGFVRDLIKNHYPHDLDGQYSCSQNDMLNFCREILGLDFCHLDEKTSYFYIGNRSLEAFSWNDSFFSLNHQEYTPNTVYYDLINFVLIDLSGMALEDILSSKIRIPIKREEWNTWIFDKNDSYERKMFALKKVPRYWKLKQIGFNDYDQETVDFLKEKIKILWNNKQFPMKLVFIEQICSILQGFYNQTEENCLITENQKMNKKNYKKCREFGLLLWNDLYTLPKYILKDFKSIFHKMKCLYGNLIETTKILFLFLFCLLLF